MPLILDYYQSPASFLVLPALGTVLAGRSILYLLPLLLVMNAWAGSRRQLGWPSS